MSPLDGDRTRSFAPPLDPDLAAVLAAQPGLRAPLSAAGIGRLRELMASGPADDTALRADGLVTVTETTVPGAAGARLPLLLLTPAGRRPSALTCYFHGGGLVVGDHRTGAGIPAHWVGAAGVAVASVGYRLAPEHRYPLPAEDCFAAVAALAGRPEFAALPLIVAGSSAGAGLAAAVTLMARDRGGPVLAGQLLMCPMLDDRMHTPSSYELDGDGVWDRRSNHTAWTSYLGDARGDTGVPAYAAPARAQDLAGLPPAYLDVGSAELFRDETITYAARLARAGVLTEMHLWPGAFHGFDLHAPDSALAGAARQARAQWLARTAGLPR
jgi:acetyl esterase/lipase